jgi:NDP-sugar pyrophosphorylase family protein
MGDLTKRTPKSLLEIGGKPILTHIIDRLNLHGIHDIIVNVHYLPDMIPSKQESRALYYYEPRLLGHKGTVYALKDWIKDDFFFVINGDTLSNVNYSEMVNLKEEDKILALMEENRCAGTWLYPPSYLTNSELPIKPYRPTDLSWFDCGTKERLKKAKEFYEKSY